jgi:GMP synthase (glutamine-hydrolysing)
MTTRRIFIIKTGGTFADFAAARGDFEDWFRAGLRVSGDQVAVVKVAAGEIPPEPGLIAGAIVTGSHEMVTEDAQWSERTAAWLVKAVLRRTPVLGVCYGHQLLALAMGGRVGDNPAGRRIGTVEIALTDRARRDPLLAGLGDFLRVHACHSQSVLEMPPGARLLATSEPVPVQAFAVGACAWGVQFHPEFDAGIVCEYLRRHRDALREEGQDPETLSAGCADTPVGTEILERFTRICLG